MVEDPGERSGPYDPASADDLASLARALESRPGRFDDPTPATDDQQLRFGPSRLRGTD